MADLRAEQIILSVISKVTGLVTTGARVYRDSAYSIDDSLMPCLTVTQGSDTINGDTIAMGGGRSVQSDLGVTVSARCKAQDAPTITLNQIRKEVHAALCVSSNLGLVFQTFIIPAGAGKPVLDVGESQIAKMDIDYIIRYVHSYSDASA